MCSFVRYCRISFQKSCPVWYCLTAFGWFRSFVVAVIFFILCVSFNNFYYPSRLTLSGIFQDYLWTCKGYSLCGFRLWLLLLHSHFHQLFLILSVLFLKLTEAISPSFILDFFTDDVILTSLSDRFNIWFCLWVCVYCLLFILLLFVFASLFFIKFWPLCEKS